MQRVFSAMSSFAPIQNMLKAGGIVSLDVADIVKAVEQVNKNKESMGQAEAVNQSAEGLTMDALKRRYANMQNEMDLLKNQIGQATQQSQKEELLNKAQSLQKNSETIEKALKATGTTKGMLIRQIFGSNVMTIIGGAIMMGLSLCALSPPWCFSAGAFLLQKVRNRAASLPASLPGSSLLTGSPASTEQQIKDFNFQENNPAEERLFTAGAENPTAKQNPAFERVVPDAPSGSTAANPPQNAANSFQQAAKDIAPQTYASKPSNVGGYAPQTYASKPSNVGGYAPIRGKNYEFFGPIPANLLPENI